MTAITLKVILLLISSTDFPHKTVLIVIFDHPKIAVIHYILRYWFQALKTKFSVIYTSLVGMGWVNYSPLGSGFGFLNFAQVGFRVFEFYLGFRNFGFGFTSGPSFF